MPDFHLEIRMRKRETWPRRSVSKLNVFYGTWMALQELGSFFSLCALREVLNSLCSKVFENSFLAVRRLFSPSGLWKVHMIDCCMGRGKKTRKGVFASTVNRLNFGAGKSVASHHFATKLYRCFMSLFWGCVHYTQKVKLSFTCHVVSV